MMMPIHGSVDDAHTILGVEEDYFPPDFKEYIRKERLYWSRFVEDQDYFYHRPTFGWVFWSQLDNFADLIRNALQKLISKDELRLHLVQFWAPTKTSEGRTLLTTQFQPFALGKTSYAPGKTSYAPGARNSLCEYRMGMCREYNSFYADAECAEEQLGLPGRVFLNQHPESTPDARHYTLKEYPQRDLALHCGIGSSWAEPVFHHFSHTCVGVLEIVSPRSMVRDWHDKSFLGEMYDIFQEFGLQCFVGYNHYEMEEFGLLCFDGYKHYEMQIGDENKARTTAFQELKTVLETVCRIHKLPLAMTWVPCSACNYLLRGQLRSKGVEVIGRSNYHKASLIEVSKCSHLRTGVVAGMVLSSSNILYCSDITQLNLVEYPLVPYARDCKFRGWFTICLQSSDTANDIHVLEFFLPSTKKSWTSLSLILGTMEENFRTFKLASGQELGDLLSVEVMDFQKGLKLHSREKIQAKGGGVRLQLRQLDQASTGAIPGGMNVVFSEDQNIPRLEAMQNGEVTLQLDSSHQPPLDPPNNGQHVVIAERNISTVTSLEERKRKTQRVDKGTGVRIEVSLEDILKCEKMSRADAAETLQVSVSTLKRVCRGYGMDRWAPHNIEKLRSFWPSPVENEGQTRQRLNSGLPSNQGLDCVAHTKPAFHDLPSNQASDSVAHTKPAFQDADIVTIKAKYENNTIKFQLSLPSKLVALQQEVAKRLNLEAGTYYIRYEDEENELILIACDQDLQDCIHTFKSLGKTSVVVQLEPK
ncbi:protein NLP7-like isoform X1 [Rhododendron vialii]|uniref:protein NLP7-like isoform X1 n=1 Tax=Rhododendron vialii TaxID=182163 RepID=UPI00266006F4|nr:protein NLP7-like isoform X1 [Rhododendron vialii]